MLRSHVRPFFALLCAFLLSSPAAEAAPPPDPVVIRALAADAYVWGLGPETVYRAAKYNTIVSQPFNALTYLSEPAAWNNLGTNAGDSSVLYISGFANFDESHELVLTVPPSSNQYYVVIYYDAYGNTIGSIGTRTTPSDTMTSYLLVGPTSPFAHKQTARIQGYEYPVMSSDTNLNWFVIRVLANTLIDASDPTSVSSVVKDVQHKFALNSLQEFQANGHQPVYPASFITPPPTPDQIQQAAPYHNTPSDAVEFFNQLGTAVASNPIPKANTGLSGTALSDLPSWVLPQYGATTTYLVPSYGQQEKFDSFAPLGLKKNGFRIPHNWGQAQLNALQEGYELGQQILHDFTHGFTADECTNYWGFVNDIVGTYPNTNLGYLYRSLFAVQGGVGNYPLDAIYAGLISNQSGQLDGDHTYKLTFTPPTSPSSPSPCASPDASWPVAGIYPPMVLNDNGNPKGFWSIIVYAPDPTQAAAPFIAQTSLLNTSYSTADTAVLSVDAATNSMTVSAPNWGTIVSSTPILFGENAADYGLTPNTVYYVVCSDTGECPSTDGTYTFQISTQWLQDLSAATPPVPIQYSGSAGPIVDLLSPPGTGPLTYGMVKPVSQLGSSQVAANQLALNPDGSLTLWLGPTLPPSAPASNWIPTPNSAYYNALYGQQVSTAFEVILRMYYATPGNNPPSILPCPACTPAALPETYVPPTFELVQ